MLDKSKLGRKFTCFKCECKFYDLNRKEPLCPSCGADQREDPNPDPRDAFLAKYRWAAPEPEPAEPAKEETEDDFEDDLMDDEDIDDLLDDDDEKAPDSAEAVDEETDPGGPKVDIDVLDDGDDDIAIGDDLKAELDSELAEEPVEDEEEEEEEEEKKPEKKKAKKKPAKKTTAKKTAAKKTTAKKTTAKKTKKKEEAK